MDSACKCSPIKQISVNLEKKRFSTEKNAKAIAFQFLGIFHKITKLDFDHFWSGSNLNKRIRSF